MTVKNLKRISFGEMATMSAEELEALDTVLWEMTQDLRSIKEYAKRREASK